MKRAIEIICFAILAAALFFSSSVKALEFKTENGTGAFVDLGISDLKVTGAELVDKIISGRNNTVTASRKNAVLLELKIEGTAMSDGQFGLYPSGFSVYAMYRRVPKIFPSIAVGVKHKKPNGDPDDYWLTEPEASMMVGCTKGDSIRFYVLFEVPDDTKTFYFQSPEIAQALTIE